MPFTLLICAGPAGGRLSLGCWQGFQLEHHGEDEQKSVALLSEALEKHRGAPAPGDVLSRAEVLGKSRLERQ